MGRNHAIRQRAGRIATVLLLAQDEAGHPDVAQGCGFHQEVARELGQDPALLLLRHGVQSLIALDQGREVGLAEEGLDGLGCEALETGCLGCGETYRELLA